MPVSALPASAPTPKSPTAPAVPESPSDSPQRRAASGEDPAREGLATTPERVHKAMKYLTKGYKEDPEALLKGALFTVTYDEMVIVKDIEMFSLCEHHMLPFFGKVHVAYIPNGKVIGLSKIPRLVDIAQRVMLETTIEFNLAEHMYGSAFVPPLAPSRTMVATRIVFADGVGARSPVSSSKATTLSA